MCLDIKKIVNMAARFYLISKRGRVLMKRLANNANCEFGLTQNLAYRVEYPYAEQTSVRVSYILLLQQNSKKNWKTPAKMCKCSN